MTMGFRIGAPRPRVTPEIVARFGKLPVACISDCTHRLLAGGPRLRPIGAARMCGPAFAVKTAPGDNLIVHKALDLAPAGYILVVDAGGDLTNAIIGERIVEVAAHRGLAGLIINGAIRDIEILRAHSMPIFAAGVTHRGPYKNGPGEINCLIAIDGMVIRSGDMIAADDDGFVCIPIEDAEAVCDAAERKTRQEADTSPIAESREWIDEVLERSGCLIDVAYKSAAQ